VWRKKEPRDNRSAEAVARACNSLIDESDASLSGHYADYLMTHKLPIPAWAWLNGLSHGNGDDIRALAMNDCTGPSAVIAELAAQIVTLMDTERLSLSFIQNRILIPLELRLAATPEIGCPHDAEEMTHVLRAATSSGLQLRWRSTQNQGRTTGRGQRNPFTQRFWEL
jgi:hypothetical protein